MERECLPVLSVEKKLLTFYVSSPTFWKAMLIFIDSEGDPLQEFSAIYVNELSGEVVDVFHHHIIYPFAEDRDIFSRQHVHGLDRDFLSLHGLCDEHELLYRFKEWLKLRPFDAIYAHAPAKEIKLLSLPVRDVCLKAWKERCHCKSHQLALSMKLSHTPVCGVTCYAHKNVCWKPKLRRACNATDWAKMQFFYHCSLYDCVECFLFYCK